MFEEFNLKQKMERLRRKINFVNNQDILVVDNDNTATDYFIKGLEEKNIKQEI
jgi:hypothetical protein